MTIREYIKIHTEGSFVNTCCICIKPFSLCGKYHAELTEEEAKIYKEAREHGGGGKEIKFFSMENFAKKVDFSIEIKKVSVSWDTHYSHDAEPETTFYIDNEEFFKISRSCVDFDKVLMW